MRSCVARLLVCLAMGVCLCLASESSLAQSKSHYWGIASFTKYAAFPPPYGALSRR